MNCGFEFVSILNKAVIDEFEWLGNARSKQLVDAFRRDFHGETDF